VLLCPVCASDGPVLYQGLSDWLYGVPGLWSMRRCGDARCGTLWLDPAPAGADLAKTYRDYYTHRPSASSAGLRRALHAAVFNAYLRHRMGYVKGVGPAALSLLSPLAHAHPAGTSIVHAEAMYLPAPAPGATLLDVGCGNGDRTMRMRQLGWDAKGLDVDPEAVRAARLRGLDARLGDLRDQDYPPESFDAIHMSHVIEHVFDPVGLMKACHDALKPAGELVAVTPNADSWSHARYREDWRGLEPPRHLQVFGWTSLSLAARSAGFHKVCLRSDVKGTPYFVGMSKAIRGARLGHTKRATYQRRVTDRIAQLIRRLSLIRNPRGGEEIVLRAKKRPSPPP
jgi:2-polyprenyl-3-methyl-5-hydroxy-6-metoxy-1,4-benzoquinol methylase